MTLETGISRNSILLGRRQDEAASAASDVQRVPEKVQSCTHERELEELRLQLQQLQAQLDEERGRSRQEIQLLCAQAQEEARQKGHEAGLALAAQEQHEWLQNSRGQLESQLAAISKAGEMALVELQSSMADLTLTAVTKVIGAQYLDDKVIKAVVDAVLKEAGVHGQARVLLHETDQLRLKQSGLADSLYARGVELQVDGRVHLGGCLVEYSEGTIDGRLETQLTLLHQVLQAGRAANGR